MGCAAATAKRRRRQAVKGYKEMAPMRRPHYATHSKEVWDRRAQVAAQRRVELAMRSAKRKAKKG